MRLFKPLLRQLHTALPDNVRHPIDIASISLQDTLQNWKMPAYRVRSSLPNNNEEGTILYLGDKPQYTTWTHKIFGQMLEPVSLGKYSLFQILKGRNQALPADITLCPINPLTMHLFKREWRILPLFVDCLVDLHKPIHELITSKGANHPMRVARRHDYHFENAESDKILHEFFHQMLIPTIQNRHEKRAFLSSWENVQRMYQNGTLITAHLDDKWIGAILLIQENKKRIRIANLGWRNGDDEWLKKGIVSALYNRSLTWAQENGFMEFNLGGSNPFVKDGPLNFKLKWGATMVPPELKFVDGQIEGARSFIGAKFDWRSQTTQSFLTSNPLLECAMGRLRAISWNTEIPPQFRRQVESGCEWVNLAESSDIKLR